MPNQIGLTFNDIVQMISFFIWYILWEAKSPAAAQTTKIDSMPSTSSPIWCKMPTLVKSKSIARSNSTLTMSWYFRSTFLPIAFKTFRRKLRTFTSPSWALTNLWPSGSSTSMSLRVLLVLIQTAGPNAGCPLCASMSSISISPSMTWSRGIYTWEPPSPMTK